MIKKFNKLSYIKKYFITVFIVLLVLFFVRQIIFASHYYKSPSINQYEQKQIKETKNNYSLDIKYPEFKNKKVNSIIKDFVSSYTKSFKNNAERNTELNYSLNLDYTLSFISEHLNVFFKITSSPDSNIKHKNILINLTTFEKNSITDLYEFSYIKDKIKDSAVEKYPAFVSEVIEQSDVNSFIYDIYENKIIVYFDNLTINESISYEPFIVIYLTQTVHKEEYVVDPNKKMVAITFDDGPSEYTVPISNTLIANNSKGTFFMLGNRMKYNTEVVKKVYESGNEIGNHSYSHKNLTRISDNELLSEINLVSNIYNEITGDEIKYLRPPYGSVNSKLISLCTLPLIKWNVDPMDWLTRDSKNIAQRILQHASDGAIILLHDLYPETVEAVKIVVPELKARGYELLTISELAKHKNKTLEVGGNIRFIN